MAATANIDSSRPVAADRRDRAQVVVLRDVLQDPELVNKPGGGGSCMGARVLSCVRGRI